MSTNLGRADFYKEHLLRTRLTEANNGIFCYCPLTLHIYKHFVYSPMSLKSGLCLQTSDSVSIQANEFTKKIETVRTENQSGLDSKG